MVLYGKLRVFNTPLFHGVVKRVSVRGEVLLENDCRNIFMIGAGCGSAQNIQLVSGEER